MTQIVLNIEDASILPSLKKVIGALNGVSIAKLKRNKKTDMELALEDKAKGRVVKCKNKEELFEKININY